MKKLILLCVFGLLVSCGASKSTTNIVTKKSLKGTWNLSEITYSKTGDYKVTFFDDVSKDCLEGSNWTFVSNNNTGTYTINKFNCESGEREFVYTIDAIDVETQLYDFLLKPKNNPDNKGYRLQLKQISDSFIQMQQNLNVDGTAFLINFNFTKI